MTNEAGSDPVPPPDDLSDVLAWVRQIDPASDATAVRGYMREMAEANDLLDTLNLVDTPLPVGFSPFWSDGGVR